MEQWWAQRTAQSLTAELQPVADVGTSQASYSFRQGSPNVRGSAPSLFFPARPGAAILELVRPKIAAPKSCEITDASTQGNRQEGHWDPHFGRKPGLRASQSAGAFKNYSGGAFKPCTGSTTTISRIQMAAESPALEGAAVPGSGCWSHRQQALARGCPEDLGGPFQL